MKILLGTLDGDGVWFAWLLKHNGHEVDWTFTDAHELALSGIVPKPISKPDPRNYDLVVFDSTDMGEDADYALSLGIPTIGDSLFADRLEDDRLFGIEMMEKVGIKVPAWEAFDNIGKAIEWLRKTHKRCVFKPFGDVAKELTYVSKSEEDMIAFIEKHVPGSGVKQFILQEFVAGTEVSTEAWWNGNEWQAINYTLEEKKLMSGGIGPNTGCAGNVVFMPPRPTPLFEQGLGKASPLLVDATYRGMLDFNAIVTEGSVYGLEWTPRFGYEGTCNLTRLLPVEFGAFMHAIATGQTVNTEARARFAATVRLSVPPYPNKPGNRKAEAHQPIKGLSLDDLDKFFIFGDVQLEDGELVVVRNGCVGTPICTGDTICSAFADVEAQIKKLEIPDLQYRNDIKTCVERRYATLQGQGWLRQI